MLPVLMAFSTSYTRRLLDIFLANKKKPYWSFQGTSKEHTSAMLETVWTLNNANLLQGEITYTLFIFHVQPRSRLCRARKRPVFALWRGTWGQYRALMWSVSELGHECSWYTTSEPRNVSRCRAAEQNWLLTGSTQTWLRLYTWAFLPLYTKKWIASLSTSI